MKTILLFFTFLLLSTNSLVAQHHESIPNTFQLIINEHGMAKSSSSFHSSYNLREDFKLDYAHNHNSSMGINNSNEDAEKKFAHREQFALFKFLEDNKAIFEKTSPAIESEAPERIVEIKLSYTYNNIVHEWSITGDKEYVEKTDFYKKAFELEELVRELARLEKN